MFPTARIFLVGCPRSGTTLLQNIISSHPEVASFPESHFFAKLFDKRSFWERKLNLGSRQAYHCINHFLSQVGHQELESKMPRRHIFTHQQADDFRAILDEITCMQGKSIWLEKTPRHLHYIDEIERWIKETKFIHIIRKGQDVIASMYEVTHEHPDSWSGSRSIERCLNRWINDVKISLNYQNSCNHFIVMYEQLINDPRSILNSLSDFIGIHYSQESLSKRKSLAQNIVLNNEPWKSGITQPIKAQNNRKFFEIFTKEEQETILEKVSEMNSILSQIT